LSPFHCKGQQAEAGNNAKNMFPFSRRSDPNEPPRPLPRWMSWLLFGFIAYLVIAGNLNRTEEPETVPTSAEETVVPLDARAKSSQDYPAIRRAFTLSNWERAFNPLLEEGLTVRDFTLGTGQRAACGDEATLLLSGRDSRGNPFDPAHDETKPLRVRIGSGESYRALEQGLIGMRAGGERVVDAPPVLVYGKQNAAKNLSTLQLRVTLQSLTPVRGADALPVLLIANPEESADVQDAHCGDTIRVRLRVSDAEGKSFAEAKETSVTLGKRELALGLDHALPGMAIGETRLIQLPADLQAHDGKGLPTLDGKALRLVEVTRLKD
jgi:FKBP-type peptidyl-prolyl cis-trans isomerase